LQLLPLKKGNALPDWKIPLSDLNYGPEESAAVAAVLQSRWLTMGEHVAAFESEFAEFVGTKHAIAVSNGTAALHLAFRGLGIGGGDEIIQPALNFVAAANMTVAAGATPVFGDIMAAGEPTLDPRRLEQLITPRTRAVVVMHYGGWLCRMTEIQELCSAHGLKLIEDACHAVGARCPDGRMAGNLGDVACFSFFSNKNLAVGEGGMVVTGSDELAHKIRRLRSHGMTTLTWDRYRGHATGYDVEEHGFNYRLDEIHAAVGRVQLSKLDQGNKRRRRLVSLYRRHLADLPGWIIPFEGLDENSACHLMPVVAPSEPERARVADALKAARIQTSLHYPCVNEFSAFRKFEAEGLKKSRDFSTRAITLPLYATMPEAHVEEVCCRFRG
jgi:dTDP-4-amino-4,6-dideoxygalactose transaminase